MQDRFQAVRNKVAEILAQAQAQYGVKIEAQVLFNLTGGTAGTASCRFSPITGDVGDYKLRFNRELVMGKHFEDMLKNTIAHEIAHLVTYARPDLGRNHNAGWRKICIELGGNGKTRHNYEITPRGGGFTYKASCGTEILVSKQMHNKIQAGAVRVLLKTRGKINRSCAWAHQGQPLPLVPQVLKVPVITSPTLAPPMCDVQPVAAAPNPATQPPVPAQRTVPTTRTGELTWAEKVRRLIRTHKPRGTSQETVISLAIMNLGMTLERARSCVKAHWNKV